MISRSETTAELHINPNQSPDNAYWISYPPQFFAPVMAQLAEFFPYDEVDDSYLRFNAKQFEFATQVTTALQLAIENNRKGYSVSMIYEAHRERQRSKD